MTSLDLILLAPLLFFGIVGFQRGFLKEALSITITLVALLISISSWHLFAGIVGFFVDSNTAHFALICGVSLFLFILLAGSFITFFLVRFVDKTLLSVPNRLAGLVFGLLKGAVITSLILLLIRPINIPDSGAINNSLLYPYVINAGPYVYNSLARIFPEARSFAENVLNGLDDIKLFEQNSK